MILAIDPGRGKCGLAVVRKDGSVVLREVVASAALAARLREVGSAHAVDVVVLGDRTGSKEAAEVVRGCLPGAQVHLVDEHRSTEEARRRYFAENPPRGWRRLIPRGLLLPPVPYDDYVAIILAERYLATVHAAK
jgi:RNase H-fold protein (predicted Holliday junction resolvase)